MYKAEDSHWWFVVRRWFIEVFLGKPSQKKLRIADIGAGTGGTTAWLARYGQVVGVEPSSLGRSLAQKRGIKLKKGTAVRTGLPANSFDLVTILDVLYHKNISDDVAALKESRRILKPGGRILVTVAAFEWLSGRHDASVHGRRRYTRGQLVKKIEQAGFIVGRASYTFFLVFPLIVISRLLERVMPIRKKATSDVHAMPQMFSIFLLVLGRLEAKLLRWVSFPFGASIFVKATKPYGS